MEINQNIFIILRERSEKAFILVKDIKNYASGWRVYPKSPVHYDMRPLGAPAWNSDLHE